MLPRSVRDSVSHQLTLNSVHPSISDPSTLIVIYNYLPNYIPFIPPYHTAISRKAFMCDIGRDRFIACIYPERFVYNLNHSLFSLVTRTTCATYRVEVRGD